MTKKFTHTNLQSQNPKTETSDVVQDLPFILAIYVTEAMVLIMYNLCQYQLGNKQQKLLTETYLHPEVLTNILQMSDSYGQSDEFSARCKCVKKSTMYVH